MSLQIGIVGLPNVGKSTLFKALTKQKVEIANYPFATIDPHVGVVPVPDERLKKLAEFSHSAGIVPAAVEFVDIAGLVKGAAEGEGLGNKFLSNIREADAMGEVVRVFEDSDIIHVNGAPDPVSDIEVIEYELILKDVETVTKRISGLEQEVRAHRSAAAEEEAVLTNLKEFLETGKPARDFLREAPLDESVLRALTVLQLLSAKPLIYICNVSEAQLSENWQPDKKLVNKIGAAPWVRISAKIESELAELDEEERKEYIAALHLKESGLEQLIRTGYEALNLITFLTTGEDETRAWTIPKNSLAPRAGRAIHSDFEEKFIRAEVINWEKLLEAGSRARARELGWLRTEGKTYVVKDGDVIEFKI
jgi:GTP-binding protein YchF